MKELENIKKVNTPDYLFDSILLKLENRKKDVVSIEWISVAAASILFFISMDFYAVKKYTSIAYQKQNTEQFVQVESNQLYNE